MMKVVFVAVAGAYCMAVQAQSSVALGGIVDAFVGQVRNAGDATRTRVLNSGGMTTSFFGFSGVEDLGGGLKASFNLNAFFQADTGSIGRFPGDPFFARDANVSLTNQYGSVQLGRGKAPNFLPSVFVNPFGDSFTFSPLILHQDINTDGWKNATVPADTGWANQIVYTSPSLSGLIANLQYQFGEQGTSNSKRNMGANFLYTKGAITAVGFYERDQVTNPNPTLITTNVNGLAVPTTDKVWMLGGAYDAGFVKGFASYGRTTADVGGYQAKTSQLGATVPIGVSFVLFDVARTTVAGPTAGRRTTASLGYDYFMSKRTDLYAVALRDQASGLQSGNTVALGVRHRF